MYKTMVKDGLNEITLIRIVLTFLLVFYHTFIIYQGGWSETAWYEPNEVYSWLDKLSYSFLLEGYVMISGYLFYYQISKSGGKVNVGRVIVKKAKRLLLPAVIFGIIYALIFNTEGYGIYDILVSGTGHLWFLLMLFWVFVELLVIHHFFPTPTLGLVAVVSIAGLLISVMPLPGAMAKSFYYLPFFIWGGYFYYRRDWFWKNSNWQMMTLSWTMFLLVFVVSVFVSRIYIVPFKSMDGQLNHLVYWLGYALTHYVQGITGCYAIYLTAMMVTKRREAKARLWTKISVCSFGIYIFQQILLKLFYYRWNVQLPVSHLLAPWLWFMIVFTFSFLISFMFQKTKAGAYLLGKA